MTDVIEQTPAQQPDTQPAQTGGTPAQGATFTQVELDRIIGERVKREREAVTKAVLEQLGYTDLDTAKAEAEAARKKREAEMSEVEKANARITELEKAAQAANEAAANERRARIADRVNGKLESLARGARASIPEDVVDYLHRYHADDVTGLIADDGKLDEKAAEKLIETAKKARPLWFGVSGHGSPSNREGRPPQPDPQTVLTKRLNF